MATLVEALRKAPVERTALILVGPVLSARHFRESSLYDPEYRRRFRESGEALRDS